MGFIDWLREKLKTTIIYKIEYKKIEMPKDNECIIFKFPKETPQYVIKEFDDRLVEFQNMQRKFITTNLNIEFIRCKKKNLRGGETYGESDKTSGNKTDTPKG